MTWLKEYPYKEGKTYFLSAKTVLITLAGSKEEHQLKMDREFKKIVEKILTIRGT